MVEFKETQQIGVNFWLQWILANTVGFAGATGLIFVLGWFDAGTIFWSWVLTGAIIGTLQWYVLQKQVTWVNWWTWFKASTIGFGIGALVGMFVTLRLVVDMGFAESWVTFSKVILPGVVIGAGAGAGAGTLQWRILRQQNLKSSWWWILVNTVGWAIALLAGRGVNLLIQNNVGIILVGASGGAIVGIITGFTLVWILQNTTVS